MPGTKPPTAPAVPTRTAAKAQPAERPEHTVGLDKGDHIYLRHPQRGPIAARIVATGAHGVTADCDQGRRHRRPWSDVLGTKARLVQDYRIVDQGTDGSILEDQRGKRRFVAGELPADLDPHPDAPEPAEKSAADDPLLGGLPRLKKSETPVLILLKAGPLANRAGLALRDTTDKLGHQTKRWTRTAQDQTAQRKPAAEPMRHGDTVAFKHGEVEGQGKIVASGADGVTVRDASGREHQVRHDALQGKAVHKPAYPERQAGEDDKAYAKRAVDTQQAPDHLPEDHGKYFDLSGKHEVVPLDKIDSSKSDAENQQGGDNSPKRMAAAYHGALGKRGPISVKKNGDRYVVTDGNGTFTGAKKHGWKTLPVQVVDDAEADPTAPDFLFADDAVKALPKKVDQPAKTEEELFRMGAEGLDQLREWLDKGKGVSSRLGHRLMTGGTEQVTPEEWQQPGGMLFIAPLKGAKRAKEKVEGEYGGDWSQLRDVVRCSIAVDGMAEMKDLLKRLDESGMKLPMQPKDRFNRIKLGSGYRDVLMNIKLPNGMLAEVQLHLKGILLAKVKGHKHYEETRTIELKPRDEWSEEETKRHADATAAMKKLYDDAFAAATKGEPMTKALGSGMAGEFEHFERDGALFRRPAAGGGITHVWRKGIWAEWDGDRTAPHFYGNPVAPDEVDDWTGGGGGKALRKAQPLLLLKAVIRGGAMGDLFAAPVEVKGHMRDGRFVAPHPATRMKRREEPPISNHAAAKIADEVFRWNYARAKKLGRSAPSTSFAAMLGGWAHESGRKVSDADETVILLEMQTLAQNRAYNPAPGMAGAKQTEGLAPAPPPASSGAPGPAGYIFPPSDQARLRDLYRDAVYGAGADPRRAARAQIDAFLSETGVPIKEAFERSSLDLAAYFASRPIDPPKPAESLEPDHVIKMRQAIARISAAKFKTRPEEQMVELYRQRLDVNTAKWKPGQGVSWKVTRDQTNRGFQIAEVSPRDLMARIRQVADTGLTTTGGDGDRMGDEWVYLGDLKRDRKYDRAA